MSREELREELREAILHCRRTARLTMMTDGDPAELVETYREDDRALNEVWKLIQRLG